MLAMVDYLTQRDTHKAAVLLLNAGLPRVDNRKVVILADVPVTQTFVLHFGILGIFHILTLAVVHYELLVYVEKLGSYSRSDQW